MPRMRMFRLEKRVDERSDDRTLREYEKHCQGKHDHNHRAEPKLFSESKESPHFEEQGHVFSSELVRHRIGCRPWRIAMRPIGRCTRIWSMPELLFSERTKEQSHR